MISSVRATFVMVVGLKPSLSPWISIASLAVYLLVRITVFPSLLVRFLLPTALLPIIAMCSHEVRPACRQEDKRLPSAGSRSLVLVFKDRLDASVIVFSLHILSYALTVSFARQHVFKRNVVDRDRQGSARNVAPAKFLPYSKLRSYARE